MPPAYFRQVTPERRGAHLRALTALTATRELGRDNLPEVQLRDEGAFTFMTDGPGNLGGRAPARGAAGGGCAARPALHVGRRPPRSQHLRDHRRQEWRRARFGAAGADSGTAAARRRPWRRLRSTRARSTSAASLRRPRRRRKVPTRSARTRRRAASWVVLKMDDFFVALPVESCRLARADAVAPPPTEAALRGGGGLRRHGGRALEVRSPPRGCPTSVRWRGRRRRAAQERSRASPTRR